MLRAALALFIIITKSTARYCAIDADLAPLETLSQLIDHATNTGVINSTWTNNKTLKKAVHIDRHVRKTSYLCSLLLILARDVAQNPGPRSLKYPRGICNKAVKWGHDAVQCDNCDHWYHVPCMNMNPEVYEAVAEHSSLTWICCNCGLPSFSSSFFSTTPVNVANSFSSLDSSIDLTSSPLIGGDSPKCPLHTSTPRGKGKPPRTKDRTVKPLRLLNINFQSSSNKI